MTTILSAIDEAGLTGDCVMDDEDFSNHMQRLNFEETCKPTMERASKVLEVTEVAPGMPGR